MRLSLLGLVLASLLLSLGCSGGSQAPLDDEAVATRVVESTVGALQFASVFYPVLGAYHERIPHDGASSRQEGLDLSAIELAIETAFGAPASAVTITRDSIAELTITLDELPTFHGAAPSSGTIHVSFSLLGQSVTVTTTGFQVGTRFTVDLTATASGEIGDSSVAMDVTVHTVGHTATVSYTGDFESGQTSDTWNATFLIGLDGGTPFSVDLVGLALDADGAGCPTGGSVTTTAGQQGKSLTIAFGQTDGVPSWTVSNGTTTSVPHATPYCVAA
jgi:hypothetical protein